MRGRLDEARGLFDEGLDQSLVAHSTQPVSLCLAGFAAAHGHRVADSQVR